MAKKSPEELKRVLVHFTLDQIEALDALATRTRIPRAVLIREGIDDLLKKHRTSGRGKR